MDLLALRERPPGWPILHQRWSQLLFMHWAYAPETIRPLVPGSVELDLFGGAAWVSLVAFTVSRMRPTLLPPIPLLSDARQINVRTYVRRGGVPGLWFFSLDATNPLAVRAARIAYQLPYRDARMEVSERLGSVFFRASRSKGGSPAGFEAEWRTGGEQPSPRPGTLDSHLLDRYLLYAVGRRGWLSARIHHRPWPLREAMLVRLDTTVLEADGLPRPHDGPLLHAQAYPFDVDIWAPQRLPRVATPS